MNVVAWIYLASLLALITSWGGHYRARPQFYYTHPGYWVSLAVGVCALTLAVWTAVA